MFIHKEMIIYFVMYSLLQRCYISVLIKCFQYVCVLYKLPIKYLIDVYITLCLFFVSLKSEFAYKRYSALYCFINWLDRQQIAVFMPVYQLSFFLHLFQYTNLLNTMQFRSDLEIV